MSKQCQVTFIVCVMLPTKTSLLTRCAVPLVSHYREMKLTRTQYTFDLGGIYSSTTILLDLQLTPPLSCQGPVD